MYFGVDAEAAIAYIDCMKVMEAIEKAGLKVLRIGSGGYYIRNKRTLAYGYDEPEFAAAHEFGHHLCFETGFVRENINRWVCAMMDLEAAAKARSVWGVPLPHIPKSERRAYRKKAAASIQIVEALKLVNKENRRREEVQAWKLGAQFIEQNQLEAYWAHAKECLLTYGVTEI